MLPSQNEKDLTRFCLDASLPSPSSLSTRRELLIHPRFTYLVPDAGSPPSHLLLPFDVVLSYFKNHQTRSSENFSDLLTFHRFHPPLANLPPRQPHNPLRRLTTSQHNQPAYNLASSPKPQSYTMSQAQELPPVVSGVPAVAADNTQKTATKKTKSKSKTLKKILPSGAGFEMYRDPTNQEVKYLDDQNETIAFKNALHAVTPNLDTRAVDAAMAELFEKATKLAPHMAATDGTAGTFIAAARKANWTKTALRYMKPTVPAKVMMRLYEARRLAIKFSGYRQHPIAYDEETHTAKAIDVLLQEKPDEKPDTFFADWTNEQLERMMGKIRRKERADWVKGKEDDKEGELMSPKEAREFAEAQKAAQSELEDALSMKMRELGIKNGGAGFLSH
ncbi:hypothetical protein CCHR01_09005 [Colletotrichum chrysophilum]|uniref:Uncharacterized protein n=1 Tax=Colletotrichum chrysophilum TaxID=1836956 RepID=A0AAD9EI57_9PEZI|nr:hypothetical protein CCHR01_09005 [Colletotrichum chrysophilum]